jgi:hypothetical protein
MSIMPPMKPALKRVRFRARQDNPAGKRYEDEQLSIPPRLMNRISALLQSLTIASTMVMRQANTDAGQRCAACSRRPGHPPGKRRGIPIRVPGIGVRRRRLGFAGRICDWLTNLTVRERNAHQDPAEPWGTRLDELTMSWHTEPNPRLTTNTLTLSSRVGWPHSRLGGKCGRSGCF